MAAARAQCTAALSITSANPPSQRESHRRVGHRCGKRQRRRNRRATILNGIRQPSPHRRSRSISASPGRWGRCEIKTSRRSSWGDSCLIRRRARLHYPASAGLQIGPAQPQTTISGRPTSFTREIEHAAQEGQRESTGPRVTGSSWGSAKPDEALCGSQRNAVSRSPVRYSAPCQLRRQCALAH